MADQSHASSRRFSRRTAPALSVERVPSLEAARAAWQEVGAQQDNVFGTWEWAAAWWRAYGGERQLDLHVVREPCGHVLGILPLYRLQTPLGPVARFIGHGPADQLGPVCRPPDREVLAAVLRDLIGRPGAPRFLLAERLRGDEGWRERLEGGHVRREAFPLIRLDGRGYAEWLAGMTPNFRQEARRRERRLAREHRLDYRLVTEEPEVHDALEELVALHRARWGERSTAFEPGRRAFHHDFAQVAAGLGWLRIWVATVDGRPAAAWLGYRFGGSEAYYQMGRDPRWRDYNVGFVLLLHTIREAAGDGLREYRMLVGDEPYKRRFATADPGLETVLVGPGPLPRLAQTLIEHRHRVPRSARRLAADRLGL